MQGVEHIGSRFIFIVAMARSGTHFLGSILGKEPWVTYLDEIFNETMAQWSPHHFSFFLKRHMSSKNPLDLSAKNALAILDNYWRHLAESIPNDQIILIDVKEAHLRILDWPSLFLDQKPTLLNSILALNCPILRCMRSNLVDHYASVRLANTTGQWILRSEAERRPLPQPFHVGADDFRQHLDACRVSEALMHRWLAGRSQVAHLAYETMRDGAKLSASARDAIEAVVARPLSRQARAGTLKQAPPRHELIENAGELEVLWCDSAKRFTPLD